LKAMQEGEAIRHHQTGSDLSGLEESPLNIYSPTLLLLAQIKLRIARSLAQVGQVSMLCLDKNQVEFISLLHVPKLTL